MVMVMIMIMIMIMATWIQRKVIDVVALCHNLPKNTTLSKSMARGAEL